MLVVLGGLWIGRGGGVLFGYMEDEGGTGCDRCEGFAPSKR
jgi:hypothetical protein